MILQVFFAQLMLAEMNKELKGLRLPTLLLKLTVVNKLFQITIF